MAKAIFDAAGLFIAVGRDAAAGETLRNVEVANIEPEARPGNGYWDSTNNMIRAGFPTPAPVPPTAAKIEAHTLAVLDLANVTWIWTPSSGLLVENDRWLNFFFWVGCGHRVVETIRGSNLADSVKELAFATYQTMIPADADKLAFWYRNHNEGVWTAYRAPLVGDTDNARAHFNFETADTEPRLFASDAIAARAWASTTIPISWRAP